MSKDNEATLGLSVKQTAKTIGVSHVTVYREINEGRLPSIKIGNRRIIRRGAIEQYLKDGES